LCNSSLHNYPGGYNLRVLDRIRDRTTREWYFRAVLEPGWSQNVLLHERERKALWNMQSTLPPPDSDLAERDLQDPYNFDFLTMAYSYKERVWNVGGRTRGRGGGHLLRSDGGALRSPGANRKMSSTITVRREQRGEIRKRERRRERLSVTAWTAGGTTV
jgi:hypothetical protein